MLKPKLSTGTLVARMHYEDPQNPADQYRTVSKITAHKSSQNALYKQ
jgi:hypothetical protein